MRTDLLAKVRTRAGAAVLGGVVALTGAGAATAAVVTSPGIEESSTTSTPSTTSAEPVDVSPVEEAVESVPAATVGAVTPEAVETTDAPAPAPAPESDPSVGEVGEDGNYTPAAPSPKAGEPPAGPGYGAGLPPAPVDVGEQPIG